MTGEIVPAASKNRRSSDASVRISLGEQRLVAFDAATQHDPDILILDEPTSGVSPLARAKLWGLIRQRADAGTAVLVSTHHMDEAEQADRLIIMSRGSVVAARKASKTSNTSWMLPALECKPPWRRQRSTKS